MGISKNGKTKNIYFSKTTFGSALQLVCVWSMDLIFLEKPILILSWEKPFPRGEFQIVSMLLQQCCSKELSVFMVSGCYHFA